LPPRPSPSRAGPHGLNRRGDAACYRVILLSCPCRRVRNSSAAILTPLARSTPSSAPPQGQPLSTSDYRSTDSSPDRSFVPSKLSRRIAATASLAVPPDSLRPSGPSDACQPALTRPPCCLAASRRPAGFTSPGSARVANLPAVFHAGSSLGTHPFRGFSPLTAAGPSRAQLSSMPFPTLRCRSFEDFSLRADAFTDAAVIHAVAEPLLSWSFPPFEDAFRPRPRTSARAPLMGFYRRPELAPRPTCALQSVREPEVRPVLPELPSVGFLPPPTLPKKVVPATPRGRARGADLGGHR
jgi:hypothetical protein